MKSKSSLTALVLMIGAFQSFRPITASAEIYFQPVTPESLSQTRASSSATADESVKLRTASGITLSSAQSGGIVLSESSISPVTASPVGYAAFEQDALNAARLAIEGTGQAPGPRTQGAAEYRYGNNQNGSTTLWNIQFDGVPPKTPPISQNFFRTKIDEAIRQARAAIRANPYHTGPGSGYALIFQSAYEATVPYTYSGNEWLAKAERDRVGTTPALASIDARLASLTAAAGEFREALDAFLSLMNHPADSIWLLNPAAYSGNAAPLWSPEGRRWHALLFQSCVEALSQLANCWFELYYTRYMKEYRPPGVAGFNDAALTADINEAARTIELLALPLNALSARGILDPDVDTGGLASQAALLRRLAEHVQERAIFFSPGFNPLVGGFSFSTYGPGYVPFLVPAQLASRPFSFDNFLSFTFGIDGTDVPPVDTTASGTSLIGEAKAADSLAMTSINEVVSNTTALNNLREETRSTYETQLTALCGQRREDPNNPLSDLVPDVLGYLLPPEERDLPLPGETLGDIDLQWKKIDQAETRLLAAYRSLAEIDEEAAIIRQFGDQRLLSYDRIAKIQLNTGEQLSALDYISGEVRAKAIEQEAEERAKQAEKRHWFSALGKILVHGAAAFLTAGGSAIFTTATVASWAYCGAQAASAVGSDALALWGDQVRAKNEAQMHRNIGRIQADAAKRQAEIQAQQTRIRSMEGAQITMEQAGQEENRIREAIAKLMIRVERQKLEILLAKQGLEFAEAEHANIIGRISYLLQEYRKVSLRDAASTLTRPDVSLRRDYQIEDARRKFRVAQEYAFVCARAARYRFTGKPSDTFQAQIALQEQNILQAQNGTQLEAAVSQLIAIRGQFLAATLGMAPLQEVRFSLRDLVAQSNSWVTAFFREPDGDWLPGLTSELQGFPQTLAPAAPGFKELSDAQFVQYITRNLLPDGTGSKILRLRFPIGFEPGYIERLNPLRERTVGEYGHVIEGPGPSYASTAAVGVFLNIRNNRSVNPTGLMPNRATLRPIGTFYTTSSPYQASTAPIELTHIRLWNPSEKQSAEPANGRVSVLYNKDTLLGGWRNRFAADLDLGSAGFQLHERSPANDHWLLEMSASEAVWNLFLPGMRDIEICMTIRGWSN